MFLLRIYFQSLWLIFVLFNLVIHNQFCNKKYQWQCFVWEMAQIAELAITSLKMNHFYSNFDHKKGLKWRKLRNPHKTLNEGRLKMKWTYILLKIWEFPCQDKPRSFSMDPDILIKPGHEWQWHQPTQQHGYLFTASYHSYERVECTRCTVSHYRPSVKAECHDRPLWQARDRPSSPCTTLTHSILVSMHI